MRVYPKISNNLFILLIKSFFIIKKETYLVRNVQKSEPLKLSLHINETTTYSHRRATI